MLYEFRMYHTAEGRAEDSARRVTILQDVFRKHGIPDTRLQWIATSGDDLPVYAWMLAWEDSAAREKAFASFYADPTWVTVRDETNAGREIMRHYNLVFLQDTLANQAARELHADEPQETAGRCYEVRVLNTLPGRGGNALQGLMNTDLPAWKRAGGRTLGVFEILSGFPGPALMQFMSWPSVEAREKGMVTYADDPAVKEKLEAEIADKGNPYYRLAKSWQFRATYNGVPDKSLSGPALTLA